MFESVVKGLIWLCVVVACAFLVLWVVAELGIALPAMLIKIFWIIVVLVAILILYRILRPHVGGFLP